MSCNHITSDGLKKGHTSVKTIVDAFSAMGFSEKQLYAYANKWSDKGFYNYGTSLRFGWFEDEHLTGEYLELAKQADKIQGV